MASHGRGGLARVFYGSVAAGVLQRVDRPLAGEGDVFAEGGRVRASEGDRESEASAHQQPPLAPAPPPLKGVSGRQVAFEEEEHAHLRVSL